MFAFMMTPAVAEEFFRRAAERKADTEEARLLILAEMTKEGLMQGVVQTDRTEDQYVADLQKNFGVLDLRNQVDDIEKTLDAVWCVDSETGEDVLMDRRTNKIIMRGKP